MTKQILSAAATLVLLCACHRSETASTSSTTETTSTVATTSTVPATDTTPTYATTSSMPPPPPVSTSVATSTVTTAAPSAKSTTAASSTTASSTSTQPAPSTAAPPTATAAPTTTVATAPPPSATGGASSADGAPLFAANCTGCHGKTGNGDTAIGKKNGIPDFHSAAVQSESDADLARIIREGKGTVSKLAHPSKHLTPDQVNALVAYIRTLR